MVCFLSYLNQIYRLVLSRQALKQRSAEMLILYIIQSSIILSLI